MLDLGRKRGQGRHTRDDLVVHSLFETCVGLFFPRGQRTERIKVRHAKAVLFVYRLPDAVRGRSCVTGETFRVDRQVNVVTLGHVIQEAEVRVPVVTSR